MSLMSSFMLGNAQHLVAWLALLPLVAGVAITFREVDVVKIYGKWVEDGTRMWRTFGRTFGGV